MSRPTTVWLPIGCGLEWGDPRWKTAEICVSLVFAGSIAFTVLNPAEAIGRTAVGPNVLFIARFMRSSRAS